VVLIWLIGISVVAVCLESVAGIEARFGDRLRALEWAITVIFTLEYMLRIYATRQPQQYVFSFFGIIDLISILPTYLGLLFPDMHYVMLVRVLRLLRVFRILKLSQFVVQGEVLRRALHASRHKIGIFLFTVLNAVVVIGAVMFVVEGPENGFTSIPAAMYWSIVTLTTVGYGDISPKTPLGQVLASCVMVLGYGIIAVPTGIVTVELAEVARRKEMTTQVCQGCLAEGHDLDAKFCKYCATAL
jgi:voltage-gated potassium channel